MLTSQSPISQLPRVGKSLSNKLKRLEISTLEDLIFYYPFRYDDLTKITPIAKIIPGQIFTVRGKILVIANRRTPLKRKIITEAIITDHSGSVKAIWFSQPFLTKTLKPGENVYFSGKTETGQNGLYFSNPVYEKITEWKKETLHTARLVPIYSLKDKITQKQFRFLIKQSLPYGKLIYDWLPLEIKKNLTLADLNFCLKQIHFPENNYYLEKAIYRIKFNELFLLQLQGQKIKKDLQKLKAEKIDFHLKETKKFTSSLPFKLTDSQRKSSWEILRDLQKETPMNRLLEGDVGSGKTLVAAIISLNNALSGFQTAFMAPTEILAKQHFKTLNKVFKNYKIKIALFTRTDKKIQNKNKISEIKKSALIKKISEGEIQIIVGTHALIQKEIEFKNLSLVIVDEQHRFGVEQRAILTKKSKTHKFPHFLSMTATPIPRSLALTLYGDLDLSVINEMPKGRKKIITKIVSPQDRTKANQFIRKEIEKGRQVFIICPLIEESDLLGVKATTIEYERLKKEIFPDLKIGLLHGKMKTREKEKIRLEFLENKINILVATSMVEVGVDIPNASVMVIEGAERFGLAQLYQFRGRVGRSEYQSYCFLFAESNSLNAKQRLNALLTAKNGFELAEKDLEIRGAGEIYGVKQSGFLSCLKLAKLTDYKIIIEAKKWAMKIINQDPELSAYPNLKEKLIELDKIIHLE
ncbi:MAG: ATP-dependent DNA helicase RecG [Parcubacteria group bacterium Athens0714_12]|nr:MAG: ATP-dependent DNA helicase RecG [Parcubacteria group bacterium Athens0714_12]